MQDPQRWEAWAILLVAVVPLQGSASAEERPSFLQTGDAFCTNEADFDSFAARGRVRAGAATETCRIVAAPTRVAILSGQAGIKTMVRLANGPEAFVIGWTNGKLPIQ